MNPARTHSQLSKKGCLHRSLMSSSSASQADLTAAVKASAERHQSAGPNRHKVFNVLRHRFPGRAPFAQTGGAYCKSCRAAELQRSIRFLPAKAMIRHHNGAFKRKNG